MKIEDEIQQTVFRSEHHKMHINILFTASWLNARVGQLLRNYNLSVQQFNILRILRGLGDEPASVKLLTDRMIDKMSNASRLVEKLKQKDLVERRECAHDRRQVEIFITAEGKDLVGKASDELNSFMDTELQALTEGEAAILNEFLDRLRK